MKNYTADDRKEVFNNALKKLLSDYDAELSVTDGSEVTVTMREVGITMVNPFHVKDPVTFVLSL